MEDNKTRASLNLMLQTILIPLFDLPQVHASHHESFRAISASAGRVKGSFFNLIYKEYKFICKNSKMGTT